MQSGDEFMFLFLLLKFPSKKLHQFTFLPQKMKFPASSGAIYNFGKLGICLIGVLSIFVGHFFFHLV